MSALTELAYSAGDLLYEAAKERGDMADDAQAMIDALESQAAQRSPELPATIGKAAQMLANLEAQPSTL